MDAGTRFLPVRGVRHRVTVAGPAGAPWLVLVHSLACDSGMWAPQVAAFAGAHRVLAYDVRGHGESDAPPDGYSMDDLAADLDAILEDCRIDACDLVGLSMGGMIGQAFALRHGDRLRSLVLAGTAARWPAAAAPVWAERIATASQSGIEPMVEPALGRWFTPAFRARDGATVAAVAAMMRRTSRAGYVGCSTAIAAIDFTPQLARIGCPVHIVVGAEDPGTPPALSAEIHAKIPGSSLEKIPCAAHLVNLEQPEAFNASVARFHARVASARTH